jgi:hypothetical protein
MLMLVIWSGTRRRPRASALAVLADVERLAGTFYVVV